TFKAPGQLSAERASRRVKREQSAGICDERFMSPGGRRARSYRREAPRNAYAPDDYRRRRQTSALAGCSRVPTSVGDLIRAEKLRELFCRMLRLLLYDVLSMIARNAG